MDEGLKYSETGLMNRVLFLSHCNDINIFVEDECKEFEYEIIFSRLFFEQIHINNIFPMKGKEGVKKAFKKFGEYYDDKPSIYLVDGDFDIILEKDMINNPNFIYLEKYNIECYYIDKNAVIRFMAGKLKKRQKDIISKINYDKWEKETYIVLKKLFLNFVIAQKVYPDEKNVGLSPYNFLDTDGYISKLKVDDYEMSLSRRISDYDELFDFYKSRFDNDLESDATRLVCGKYVLASLATYLRKNNSVRFRDDDFRYFLVNEFDIRKLTKLKQQIQGIL